MPAPKRSRRIAYRLADGKSREKQHLGVPPHVRDALRLIARHRNESVSWLLEQTVYESLSVKKPKFIEPKGGGES